MSPGVPKPKPRKQRKRFSHRRVPAYQAWIRTQPCWFCAQGHRRQTDLTECEHLKTRGAGGDDFNNLLPTCAFHRVRRDAVGPKTFFAFYEDRGLTVFDRAREYTARYHHEHPELADRA